MELASSPLAVIRKLTAIVIVCLLCVCSTGCKRQLPNTASRIASPYAGRQRFHHGDSEFASVYFLSAASALADRFGAQSLSRMDPNVVLDNSVDILDEMRKGLSKRCDFLPTEFGQRAEMRSLQMLGRACAMSQQALLAHGNWSQAIKLCLETLEYGRTVQGMGLVIAMSGTASQLLAMQSMSRAIDQMPQEAAKALSAKLQNWLDQPRPYVHIWSRQFEVESGGSSGGDKGDTRPYTRALSRNAALPFYKQRAASVVIEEVFAGSGNEDVRVGSTLMTGDTMQTYIAIAEARAQLLLIEAVVRQFRLRNNRLPTTLHELGLPGRYLVDPFGRNGSPFRFVARNSDYRLYSMGPDRIDNGGRPASVPLRYNAIFPQLAVGKDVDLALRDSEERSARRWQ